MNTKYFLINVAGLMVVTTSLSGCFLFAAGAGAEAGYVASQDEKTAGETIDDQLIVTSIKTKLLASSKVSGMNMNVDSTKGIVTLRGFAQTHEERQKAIEIARSVSGVKDVVSKLTLQS